MDSSPRLVGEDWQRWCDQLLQLYYGPGEYQKIPDNQQGDAGLEGFSNSGHAYQAYGPDEPLATDQRYKKHRTKITNDIRKFIENEDILSQIFGTVKIKRWILLVPFFDSKEIVKHASKKTKEVIDRKISYVDTDFQVMVQDEDAFAREREQLVKAGLTSISVNGDVADLEIEEWADENNELISTLDAKISHIKTISPDSNKFKIRNEMIKLYLNGQNVLNDIREYPSVYENIITVTRERERYLATETIMSSTSNHQIFLDSLDKIKNTLASDVPGVARGTLESLAWGTLADWLIRCPLDFVEKNIDE